MANSSPPNLLLVILDTNLLCYENSNDTQTLPNEKRLQALADYRLIVESLFCFLNPYFLLHRYNRLVLLGVDDQSSHILFPYIEEEQTTENEKELSSTALLSGTAEEFAAHNLSIMDYLAKQTSQAKPKRSASVVASALSRALCIATRNLRHNDSLQCRILILQRSMDISEHYVSFMNCIFSAQKNNITIDACMLNSSHSSFLQQATDLTKGIYYQSLAFSKKYRVQRQGQVEGQRQVQTTGPNFLQCLLTIFLADTKAREILTLPQQTVVDYRAMCFCHQRTASIAYVCTICLSLFCQYQPYCTTCGIRSPVPLLQKEEEEEQIESIE